MDEQKVLKFDINSLTEMIKNIVQESTKEEIIQLKREINDFGRKSVFPHGDGNELQSISGNDGDCSIIDTSHFKKSFNIKNALNFEHGSTMMGRELVSLGVPFKRLSKEMEQFAFIMKQKGNLLSAQQSGLNIKDYNNQCYEKYVKVGVNLGDLFQKQAGLSEGLLTHGGALVPIEFYTAIIEFAIAQSRILSQVWRLPMSRQVLNIPRLNQAANQYFGGIIMYSPGEGGEKTSSHPTFEQLTFTAKKRAALVHITDELIDDSAINIVNYLVALVTRAFQFDMEGRIISGVLNANIPCVGITQDPFITVTARQNAGQISYRDIFNMDANIDENFSDLSWLTRKASAIQLVSLVDNNNRPIFYDRYDTFSQSPTRIPQLLNYPVYYTRNCAQTGLTGDLILCDLGWYLVTMRQEMAIDVSNAPRFPFDETSVRFVSRYDGRAAVPEAFTYLGGVSS